MKRLLLFVLLISLILCKMDQTYREARLSVSPDEFMKDTWNFECNNAGYIIDATKDEVYLDPSVDIRLLKDENGRASFFEVVTRGEEKGMIVNLVSHHSHLIIFL